MDATRERLMPNAWFEGQPINWISQFVLESSVFWPNCQGGRGGSDPMGIGVLGMSATTTINKSQPGPSETYFDSTPQ